MTERWRRFTILDALILIGCLCVAFAWGKEKGAEIVDEETSTRRSSFELFTYGAVAGLSLAGPVVLSVQWLLRGGRSRLSAGESTNNNPLAFLQIVPRQAILGR